MARGSGPLVGRLDLPPLSRGGLGVRVEMAAINGKRGVLLVPELSPLLADPDRVRVRSVRVERELGAWVEKEELAIGNAHADRWALYLIAGNGRAR